MSSGFLKKPKYASIPVKITSNAVYDLSNFKIKRINPDVMEAVEAAVRAHYHLDGSVEETEE